MAVSYTHLDVYKRQALKLSYLNPGRTGLIGAPTYPMLRDATQAALIEILESNRIPHEWNRGENFVAVSYTHLVHADRNRLRNSFASLRTLSSGDILLHGRSPFAPRVRIHWERIASRRGPAFSSHLGNQI